MSKLDSHSPHRENGWHALLAWPISRPVVAIALTLLFLFLGLYTAPLPFALPGLDRDPVPVDAIPDVGENQQIVFTAWPGRSPRDVEDQLSYPLTTALLGLPGVKSVRSSSAFGFSSIYVIFGDQVEFYWSRSRLLEKLSSLPPGTLPDGVNPVLGPDATALGQVFWYTLQGRDAQGAPVGGWDPDELRSLQDWTIRPALQSVEGVSEVASIGGFVREYQIDVDPEAMRAHKVTLSQIANAVRRSNLDVGARTLEINSVEYVVRSLGFIKTLEDLESIVVVARGHTPIRIRDVGRVSVGPAMRRGALDDAGAPAVGGVVVARHMENPLAVISRVKEKIEQIQSGLPRRRLQDGTQSQVQIVPFYDRTQLINETLRTLSSALYQEVLVTILVVLVMMGNLRSSLLVSSLLPLGVLATFTTMKYGQVDANIMALGGIAIAIGTMVDMGIVLVENMSRRFQEADPELDSHVVASNATAEIAPALVTSTLTTVLSFLPVFGLTDAEFKLFSPLAYTKTFAICSALVITLAILPTLTRIALTSKKLKNPAPDDAPRWHFLFSNRALKTCLLATCAWLLARFDSRAAGIVALVSVTQLVGSVLPVRTSRLLGEIEKVLVILLVTLLLAKSWMPLGTSGGWMLNSFAVGLGIAAVLSIFWIFERFYGAILTAILSRKRAFLLLPAAALSIGLLAWLGSARLLSPLPSSLQQSHLARVLAKNFPGLNREYMPPFDEGSFLLMPTTTPHASIGEVLKMMSYIDAAIAGIPEVDRVVGKLGRSESALDPAPISMIETMISYHPEYRRNTEGELERQWRDHIRSPQDIWEEIQRVSKLPGLTGAPRLTPINARVVMLQSGMRAPMGIKVRGPDLESIESFGLALEKMLKRVPSIRPETVFADRVVGKPYLEIRLDREAIGRFGLGIADVQELLQIALGGKTLTRTVEGRERYAVRVRYMREERDSLEAIDRIVVPTPSGQDIPLSQLADIHYSKGPQVIRSEDTFLTSYVLFDKVAGLSTFDAVDQAKLSVARAIRSGNLELPPGVSYEFAGSYKNQMRSERRMVVLIPLALCLIFFLLYLQFPRISKALSVFAGSAIAVSGGFILFWLHGKGWFLNIELLGVSLREVFDLQQVNLSVAAWVGFIALVGIATDDGVVMTSYLDQSFREQDPQDVADIRRLTVQAGRRRIRPCLMTTATTILALGPVLSSQGRGSEVMRPMALPIVGGMAIELLTLFVVPTLYCLFEERAFRRRELSGNKS